MAPTLVVITGKAQAMACMKAGKHVQVEIPLCDVYADGEAVVKMQKETGLVAMCGHTRRFNPSHQWVHHKVKAGEFNIQQMDVQTYFFRRTNMNALGQARSWTDHLLWHHAAHTVDLFAYQCGSPIVKANAIQGPIHPSLGIAMDMSIQLKAANGAICTLSLSFNNDGPLGTFFRYIGDTGTYIARYDDLVNGKEEEVAVHQLANGDVIRVRPGDNVAADGQIVSGEGSINQANITGESLPVDKKTGDQVFAGTINLTGVLEIKVTRAGTDSTLNRVRELILAAEKTKLRP